MQIDIKQAKIGNEKTVMELLDNLPLTGILSDSNFAFRQIFIKHLLSSPRGKLIIALNPVSKRVIGYVIAIRHPRQFWISFGLWHPFISWPLLALYSLKKIKTIIKKTLFSSKTLLSSNPPVFKWSPSSPQIARIIFIGVLPEFRSRGVAKTLYLFLAKTLKGEDCSKIEAHIDAGNNASLKLHQKTGWKIRKMGEGDYKAVLNLK